MGVVGILLEIDRAEILNQSALFHGLFNSKLSILGGRGIIGT